MKELPMFTYNLWVGCLHPDTSCQLLCPVINNLTLQSATISKTLMCTLHNFFINKARCSHTSTVAI